MPRGAADALPIFMEECGSLYSVNRRPRHGLVRHRSASAVVLAFLLTRVRRHEFVMTMLARWRSSRRWTRIFRDNNDDHRVLDTGCDKTNTLLT